MKILKQLPLAAKQIGAIGKDKQNVQQGYKYRGIEDVMNAVHPAFIENGIICVSKVLDQKREERQTQKGGTLLYSILQVEFTFYADDGSSVQCVTVGEGMDSGDKASNKAMSAALKYALTQTCMIPFECIDSETDDHEVKVETKKPKPNMTQKQWADACLKFRNGEITIAKMQEYFTLTEDQLNELNSGVKL